MSKPKTVKKTRGHLNPIPIYQVILGLINAASFSLSVHIKQGMLDLSEKMAVEKLRKALDDGGVPHD